MPGQVRGAWTEGRVKLFLSHSALHKTFAGEVAGRLARLGVAAFVAHDAMQVTKPWQDQIEVALTEADAMAVLLHPEVNDSHWCQQEVGWALGRRIPLFVVRIGADPRGFVSGIQWPTAYGEDAHHVARLVAGWLNTQHGFGPALVEGLLAALRAARSYMEAEAVALSLDEVGELTASQWEALDDIFLTNNQVGGSILANRALQPLYARADRDFPARQTDG